MKAEEQPLTANEEYILLRDRQLLARTDHGYSAEEAEKLTLQDAYDWFTKASRHTGPGFQAIERVLILMHADVQWLYVITSALILFFVFMTIWQQSIDPILSCLLFVITSNFFLSLNIVSQYMAISICLFACRYVEERRPVQFVVLVLVAACFHVSALVFLTIYILPRIRIKPLWCTVIVVLFFFAAPFFVPLLGKGIEILAPKYTRYFNDKADFEWVFFALGLAVFVIGSYYFAENDRPYYRLWYYANIIGLVVLCFSGRIPWIKRINYYFAAPHFMFLPLVVSCEKKTLRRRILRTGIVLLFVAETIIAVGYMNKNGVLPYYTFLQGDRARITDTLAQSVLG